MENTLQRTLTKNSPLDIEKWRLIVNAWDAKIESQKAYCQRLGLNHHTFSYARSKLREEGGEKSIFVPLKIKETHNRRKDDSDLLIVENINGMRLYISPHLSADQLVKIFKLSGW